MDTKETKLIFKPFLARKLLKLGNNIVDIKPDKNNTDKTVFVFEVNEKFNTDMTTLLKKADKEIIEETV